MPGEVKMKICIVSGIFPPDIGGPASYVPRIAEELAARENQISVVCLSESLKHDDVDSYSFPVRRISRSMFKPMRILKTISTIYETAKDSNLIYVNGLSMESTIAAWMLGIPTVHKVVGDYAWERAQLWKRFNGTLDQYQLVKKGIILRLLDLIRTFPLKRAKAVIVPSLYLQKVVLSWGVTADNIKVVYNSVEIPEADTSRVLPRFEGRTLITVGRLVPWKGMDSIIKVMPQLDNTRLVIIGAGPLRQDLEQLSRDLNISDRIIFMGSLSKSEVISYLRQSTVFVLNSTYEGLPHIVLEAMRSEIPVIATAAGGTVEVIKDRKNGILIPVGDEQALLSAISQLLEDESLSRSLVIQAKHDSTENFSFESMINQASSILHGVALTHG